MYAKIENGVLVAAHLTSKYVNDEIVVTPTPEELAEEGYMEVIYPPQEEQVGTETYVIRDDKIYVIYTAQDATESPAENGEGE